MTNRKTTPSVIELSEDDESRDFAELIAIPIGDETKPQQKTVEGIVVGTLVGLADNGATPVVTFPGQTRTAPIAARTTMDLQAPHVGRQVVLVFEAGNLNRPIITGCIRPTTDCSASDLPGRVSLEADGERLVVSAIHGLVLRCGKASITLSPAGKIVIRGTHVISHSSGVNRIKGGSVQVN